MNDGSALHARKLGEVVYEIYISNQKLFGDARVWYRLLGTDIWFEGFLACPDPDSNFPYGFDVEPPT